LLTNTGTNAELLKSLGITHVHVHSLAGFNARFLSQLPEIIRHAGLQYDVTLHDYMTICPRIHLTDEVGRYCGEPSRKTCASCIRSHGTPFGKVDIVQWREQGHALLQGARKVFVPNNDVTERMRKYYPDVMYSLRPHFEADLEEVQPVRVFRKPGVPVRVGIIGAIGPHKGSYILQRCAIDALERQLPLEFVVLGYTNIESLSEQPNVTVTGKYEESEIHDLISEQHLHLAFFPATWPETYSYTLSLALSAGLKPVAFDIGAIADRMRRLGYEDLLIPFSQSNSPAAINDFLLNSISIDHVSSCEKPRSQGYENMVSEYYKLGN
jgi:glycosyltransferase involved in cell wall biosynthesis